MSKVKFNKKPKTGNFQINKSYNINGRKIKPAVFIKLKLTDEDNNKIDLNIDGEDYIIEEDDQVI